MNVTTAVRIAAKSSAVPAGLLRRPSADDLVVLLYHRVESGTREIDVDADSFGWQMALVADSGRATSLDDALGGDARGVVVSIDDGFSDFYTHVLPILVRYRVPAILYLATGFVEGQAFAPAGDALSWSQLSEAVATGLVTVGAHTHSHYNLSTADETTAYAEMGRSKDLIEERLGRPCRHFSYPWSYSSEASERVAGRLFESAALTWKTNRRSRLDPHRLGRTPIFRGDTSLFFKAKMRGRLDAEALVYRAARRGPWRKS